MRTRSLLALLTAAAVFSGCEGCRNTQEPPLPVAPEGRLPRVAAPAVSPVATVNSPPACVSMMSASVEEGAAPLTVRFTAEGMCTDAEGEFTWDFGDGTPAAAGATAEHTYEKPGEYNARLIMSDKANAVSDWDEIQILVTAPDA